MKTLLIVRHAKSDWGHAGLTDHDRPLNERGRRDAPRMGRRLADRGAVPQRIRSSTALRARTTAAAIAEELDVAEASVELDATMYATSVDHLFEVIEELDDAADVVMLVGHNPEFSELVARLTDEFVELPTCAVAEVRLPVEHWADASAADGELVGVETPKH
ncbi:SixA phosphatase family protein [Agromyces aerolatus]|uniref:SixA phosphatase family protein n=1 Tax=Agromyces sp. LY-1074 TaxID=3074080 RepID=UPI00285B3EAC|nr:MULTISPECIES: histidine phosphatase family protein [unclassified Agromyces]MDR5698646.1 histidine phosphatase family protein [Agromyces sp. LY-1074]MDR5704940.1 histidine phosphatase family protein [Agromyces sp. LY-1358]